MRYAFEGKRLSELNARLDDFCKQTGLQKQYDRSRVLGFGRGEAQKTAAAGRKPPAIGGKSAKTIDNSTKSGIINTKSGVNMHIDKFTPCLEDAKTGEILPTSFALASKSELKQLKGWNFNWVDSSLKDSAVYKLTLKGDNKIQGLVALTKYERDKAMYVNIVESAPHNLGVNKQYNGVGGHLYAIAVQKSVECGYGGFVFMDAKNIDLVEHYRKTLKATWLGHPHEYRMFINEESAQRLLAIYTMEEV